MISTYYEARGTMSRHSLLCLLALCLSRAGEAFTHNNGKQFARAPCSCRGAPPSFIASASTSTRQFNSLREVNDSNMKDLLFQPADGKVVLVDACASFCGPCKLIEPYLLEAGELQPDGQ